MSQLQVPARGKARAWLAIPGRERRSGCRGRAAPAASRPRGPSVLPGLPGAAGTKATSGRLGPHRQRSHTGALATGSHGLLRKTKETIVTRQAPARLPPPPSPHRAATNRPQRCGEGPAAPGDEPQHLPKEGSGFPRGEPWLLLRGWTRLSSRMNPPLGRTSPGPPALPGEGGSEPALCPAGTNLLPVPVLGSGTERSQPEGTNQIVTHRGHHTPRTSNAHERKARLLPRGGYGPRQSHTATTPEIREASFLPSTGEFVKCLQITFSDHTGTKVSDNTSLVAPLPCSGPGGTPRALGVGSHPSLPLPPAGTAQGLLGDIDIPDFGTQQHTSIGTSEL